ncbi:MAG: type II toxin-antitoxin system RelB/DinJ family antitoxin [Holophagaceae bacterium]|nr:type II toxin-antitoxin system RelB/DinJ family antitoxin [Holophagaceae bacterium]
MATIQVRVDDSTKSAADSLFGGLGLDTSTAVRIFLNVAIEHNGLPFAVRHHTPKNDLLEAVEDVRHRRDLIGPFDTVEDAIKAMLAD